MPSLLTVCRNSFDVSLLNDENLKIVLCIDYNQFTPMVKEFLSNFSLLAKYFRQL